MLLNDKTAVIYGGGGAVARAFAREGAKVLLAGRSQAKLDSVALAGTTVEAVLTERARTGTLLGRVPKLAEVANYAAFVASDRASAMTGAIANLTCGSLVD